MAQSEWVKDVSEADFQQDVVERSKEVPVVIDFWAEWCGPCRRLAPLLEKAVNDANGKFFLAKVNVDENQGLAGAFQVNGIPSVFAVRDAKVVNHFEGLLGEDELQEFLNSLTPSEADKQLSAAADAELRDPAEAEQLYRQVISADPKDEAARVGLARVLLQTTGRESDAAALVQGIEVGEHQPEADRLRKIMQLRETPHTDLDLTAAQTAAMGEAESAPARLKLGAVLAARGDYAQALEALIAAAEMDKKLAGSEVRELMVSIFTIIGVRSEMADEYRDKLRSLLY